jgi:hypothetical protein
MGHTDTSLRTDRKTDRGINNPNPQNFRVPTKKIAPRHRMRIAE